MRALSEELGATVEAGLKLAIDRGQDIGLRLMQRAAGRGGPGALPLARFASAASRLTSLRVPRTSGQVVSQSSLWIMQGGLRVLRALRQLLETPR